mgnify:FL=1
MGLLGMEHKRYGRLPTNAQSVIDEIRDLGFGGDAESWDAVFRETEPADMAETINDATIELRAMRTIEAQRERAANEPRYLRNEPADLTMRLERRIASAEQRIADLERRARSISVDPADATAYRYVDHLAAITDPNGTDRDALASVDALATIAIQTARDHRNTIARIESLERKTQNA